MFSIVCVYLRSITHDAMHLTTQGPPGPATDSQICSNLLHLDLIEQGPCTATPSPGPSSPTPTPACPSGHVKIFSTGTLLDMVNLDFTVQDPSPSCTVDPKADYHPHPDMLKYVQLCHHCRGPPLPSPDMFKRIYYEACTVAMWAVDILPKCFLVLFCVHNNATSLGYASTVKKEGKRFYSHLHVSYSCQLRLLEKGRSTVVGPGFPRGLSTPGWSANHYFAKYLLKAA